MFSKFAQIAFAVSILTFSLNSHSQTVFSNDFSSGNPVSGTAYSLIPTGVFTNPGQYRVVSNPSTAFTNGYLSFFDHTSGTASGSMMFFDGAADARTIWSASATLTAGSPYTFSYWAALASLPTDARPNLVARINGNSIGVNLIPSSTSWVQFTHSFVPTLTGLYAFSISDLTPDSLGNDGVLDDIILSGVPEPSTVATFLLGTAALALILRRRSTATRAEA